MKILTECHGPCPLSVCLQMWTAIDEDTFTAEYRDGAPFSTSPQGWGRTAEEAIADLKEQLEDYATPPFDATKMGLR